MNTSDVTIYHNPKCGTSRNVLAFLREAGIEPTVIEYLKTPPDRATLEALVAQMGVPVREVVRAKEQLYAELGLDDPATTDAQLLDAMLAHPILINRPIVVTPWGTKLCRPSEAVGELLAVRPELVEGRARASTGSARTVAGSGQTVAGSARR